MGGISFDLEKPYVPKSRHHYPRAPFAQLWTQIPEDADRAYALYIEQMGRTWDYRNPLYEIWGGRAFNVGMLLTTFQYQSRWEECRWTNDERAELALLVSPLSARDIYMLRAVAGVRKPVAVSRAVYQLDAPGTVADCLVSLGLLTETETKPTKKYPSPEPALLYARDDAELLAWEFARRDWLCEWMVRYQYAYEATASDLIGYRESGVVDRVEILAKDCCSVCRKRYPKRVPVSEEIEIPIEGCNNPDGCTCCVSPVVSLGR